MGKNQLAVRVGGALILVLCIAGFFYWKSTAAKSSQTPAVPDITLDTPATPPANITANTPSAPATPAVNVPTPTTEPDALAGITNALQGDKAADKTVALAQIHELVQQGALIPGDIFSSWVQPLIDAKQYADVESLGLGIILNKPYDQPNLEIAQAARAQAQLAQKNYAQALAEAKSYYNIVAIEHLQSAVDLLEQIASAKDPMTAGQYKEAQIAAIAATKPFDVSTASQPLADAQKTGLAAVVVDPTLYQGSIKKFLQRRPSNTGLRGLGVLYLLADQPTDALKAWLSAETMPGNSAKSNRLSMQGVAASLRAMDSNPARANAFLTAMRAKDTGAIGLFTELSGDPAFLVTASVQCPIASVK